MLYRSPHHHHFEVNTLYYIIYKVLARLQLPLADLAHLISPEENDLNSGRI